MARPDDDYNKSIVPFKSGARAKIEKAGYAIIVTVGNSRATSMEASPNAGSNCQTRRLGAGGAASAVCAVGAMTAELGLGGADTLPEQVSHGYASLSLCVYSTPLF